jgi:hypothetical protein
MGCHAASVSRLPQGRRAPATEDRLRCGSPQTWSTANSTRSGSARLTVRLALQAAGKKPVATPHAGRSDRAGRRTFSGAPETKSISLGAASPSCLGHAPIGSTDIAAAGGRLPRHRDRRLALWARTRGFDPTTGRRQCPQGSVRYHKFCGPQAQKRESRLTLSRIPSESERGRLARPP